MSAGWNLERHSRRKSDGRIPRPSGRGGGQISRTRLLINALEDELDELANDEQFHRRLSDAYYDGRVDYDTVEAILGREEAMRLKLLRGSIDRTPAVPTLKDGLPSDDAFYDGEVSEWTDSSPSDSDDEWHA